MTMPLTAEAVQRIGGQMPADMSDEQLVGVIEALRQDLGDDAIDYIERAINRPTHCSCGAFHLTIDDPDMTDDIRQKLLRLVASPFGLVFAARYNVPHFRFGWEGLEEFAPQFMAAVRRHPGTQEAWGKDIPDDALNELIGVIRAEEPGVVEMIEASASVAHDGNTFHSHAVTPEMVGGQQQWKDLIGRLMLVGATPMRKIIDEWLRRRFNVIGGVVNCCIYPAEPTGDTDGFIRRRWAEQVSRQLTPDC